MAKYAKSYAGPLSVIATVAAGAELLGVTGEDGLLNKNGSKTSQLQAENAGLKAERYADGKTQELYNYTTGQFQRLNDAFITQAYNDGKMEERNACQSKEIDRLQSIVEQHSKELCDNRVNIANINGEILAVGERVNTLAHTTKDRFAAMRDSFTNAISLEAERRECGDENILTYVNCNFVKNVKRIPRDEICPPIEDSSANIAAITAAVLAQIGTSKAKSA